jgi:hypothetical protein
MVFHQLFSAAEHGRGHGRRVGVSESGLDVGEGSGGFSNLIGKRIVVVNALIILDGLRKVSIGLEAFGVKKIGLGLGDAVEVFADEVERLFGLIAFEI